jgi:hypothetical protein
MGEEGQGAEEGCAKLVAHLLTRTKADIRV